MYSYMRGRVINHTSNQVILEVNNIGYEVIVSNPYSFELDKDVVIYLYEHIREDEHTLYGFKNLEEKDLFLKLINVKGLGPKMAIPMFATGSINGIVDAVERENILYLKKFPKIGDKVAKQIILDLKGKLSRVDYLVDDTKEELVEVLKGLGYKEKDFKGVISKVDNSKTLEEQVKEALRLLLR